MTTTSRRKFLQLAGAVAGLGVLKPKALFADSAASVRDSGALQQFPDEDSFTATIEERLCMVYTLEATMRGNLNRERSASMCFPAAFICDTIQVPKNADNFEVTLEHVSNGTTQRSFSSRTIEVGDQPFRLFFPIRFEKGDTLKAYFTNTLADKRRNNRAAIYFAGWTVANG